MMMMTLQDVSNVSEALFEKAEALVTSIFLHHSLDEIAPTLPSARHESIYDPGFGSDDEDDADVEVVGGAGGAEDEMLRKRKRAERLRMKQRKGKEQQNDIINPPALFSEIVREAFMNELKDYVTTWGVVLMDMSIEKLEFHDSALRDLLTQRASNKLQTASNRANIAAQAQTGIQKAQGLAQEARVKADAELYTAEQRAKGARLQDDTDLARQLAVMRATRDIVEAAGNKTSFIPWNMRVDLREGAAGSDQGYHLSEAGAASALARHSLVGTGQ
jgi:hypothetical protein